jgi:PAS domain S-box-containing protein
MLDPAGVVLTWNRGAQRIKGYRADEIVGRHFSTFYTAEDKARDHPRHELEIAVREGRYEEEGWRVRRDGSRFWANVVITAMIDDRGRLVGFGKVTRDLTARRLSEEQLRNNAADLMAANAELDQFRRLVSSVRDYAIFMLDAGGHVRSWNAGAHHIKGYAETEVIGRHFSLFYTAEDRARRHPQHELEIAAREGRYEEEGWRVRKDGTTFWANVVITAVRNEQGILIGFAKVTRDLTERRESEEALRRAHDELRRSNEELDRFAVVAAHDLSAPLTTVAGFAQLLQSSTDLPGQAADHARHILASTERMQALIDGLLAYARAGDEARDARVISLSDALGNVVADLGAAVRERGAAIEAELDDAPPVLADPADLEMVLRNLVANAIKFGDPEAPHVRVRAEIAGDMCRVDVCDNGIGVDTEDQARIFEAFQRSASAGSTPGTGLGLAICERVVRRWGGAIGVDSQPTRGSRFWFTLPRGPGAAARPAPADRTAQAPS